VLGGTSFKEPRSELIVKAVARHFARELVGDVVVLTGGMPGVQETFARSLGVEVQRLQEDEEEEDNRNAASCEVVNLLPAGQHSDYGVGRDLEAGATLEERMEIFAQIGHIYLAVEGGPGVAKEASVAFGRGATVLPVASTGGASSGMFGFPAAALERPTYATQEQWDRLQKSAEADSVGAAVVQIIETLISLDPPL